MTESVGAVVLAAGNSNRMNSPKPFLRFDKDNTFLGKIISCYLQWGCSEIAVVLNRDTKNHNDFFNRLPENITCVVNEHPEYERFYSVKLGLEAIRVSSFCFLQNVDNPFIDAGILDRLYERRHDTGYVSPVYNNKGGHPVLLNRETMNRITHWPDDSANLREVLNTMECLKLEMSDDRVLININSREEYADYFSPPHFPSPEEEGPGVGSIMQIHHGVNLQ